jgi:hypothetical protein
MRRCSPIGQHVFQCPTTNRGSRDWLGQQSNAYTMDGRLQLQKQIVRQHSGHVRYGFLLVLGTSNFTNIDIRRPGAIRRTAGFVLLSFVSQRHGKVSIRPLPKCCPKANVRQSSGTLGAPLGLRRTLPLRR